MARMSLPHLAVSLVVFSCLLMLCGCSADQEKQGGPRQGEIGKELLIFCGITMIDPVRELMSLFQEETGVKMTMSYGGSADLMQSIRVNKTGDIYFPGNESFILQADRENLLQERKQVGVNQAALFVRKGNPRRVSGDLHELTGGDLQIAIGHPDLGSIGKESKRLLEAAGIYDRVVAASAMMQPDSKGLTSVLREGRVDVVLNWQAVLFIGDNAQYMEVLPIAGGSATPHKLIMAITAHSREPELAGRFLDFCASEQGRAVFGRFGF